MALRVYILNATGAIASSTLFASGVIDAAAIAAGAVGASEVDLTDNFNFTGALQHDGVDVATGTGSLYYAVVRAASTANISNYTSAAPNTVDGVSLSANDDVLVWKQTTNTQNGILNVDTLGTGSNGAWSRPADRDTGAELPTGLLIYVKEGTLQAQTLYKITSGPATVGSDPCVIEPQEEGMTPVGANGEPEVVGTGDGSTLAFDLSTSGIIYSVVFVNGIEQAGSVYSISAGTGAGGVDQLVFTGGNAPASGVTIEAILLKRS
jgi:hypothetical protein